jgi:hypothetical protein
MLLVEVSIQTVIPFMVRIWTNQGRFAAASKKIHASRDEFRASWLGMLSALPTGVSPSGTKGSHSRMIRSRIDRRRRTLTDDSASEDNSADWASEAREPAAYGHGVSAFADLRLRDLIPRRRRFVAAWLSLAVLVMAAIIGAHLGRAAIASWLQLGAVPGIDLSQPANLAAWFTSVAFGGAGLLATIIYGLRRFRLDDYQGQYRLWLFVVPSLFLGSICSIVPLHETWSLVCARLIGSQINDALTKFWWVAPALLAIVGIGGRVFFEVKRNRTCLAAGLVGIASLSACLLAKSGYLAIAEVEESVLIWGTQMLGAGSLALCCMLYARQMLLEIEGVLNPQIRQPKPRKSKRKPEAVVADADVAEAKPRFWQRAGKFFRRDKPAVSEAMEESDDDEKKSKPEPVAKKANVPAPHFAAKPAAAVKPVVSTKPVANNDDEDEVDDDAPSNNVPRSKMSRAERKKLRRQERDDD